LILWDYQYQWTGFAGSGGTGDSTAGKTLWDWLDLLIIPLIGSLIALLIREQIRKADIQLANQERENERAIAKDRYQENILQSYIDRISEIETERRHLIENNKQ
jgi:hypothetical protein